MSWVCVYADPVAAGNLVLQPPEVDEVRWFGLDEVWRKIQGELTRFCVFPAELKILRDFLGK